MNPPFALFCIVSVFVLGYLIGRCDRRTAGGKVAPDDDPTRAAEWWKRGDPPPY